MDIREAQGGQNREEGENGSIKEEGPEGWIAVLVYGI